MRDNTVKEVGFSFNKIWLPISEKIMFLPRDFLLITKKKVLLDRHIKARCAPHFLGTPMARCAKEAYVKSGDGGIRTESKLRHVPLNISLEK